MKNNKIKSTFYASALLMIVANVGWALGPNEGRDCTKAAKSGIESSAFPRLEVDSIAELNFRNTSNVIDVIENTDARKLRISPTQQQILVRDLTEGNENYRYYLGRVGSRYYLSVTKALSCAPMATVRLGAQIFVTDELTSKICSLVSEKVANGFDTNLDEYTVEECLDQAEIEIVGKSLGTDDAQYKIEMSDSEIAALEGTDLWLACELSAKGKLLPENIELLYCSIEQ